MSIKLKITTLITLLVLLALLSIIAIMAYHQWKILDSEIKEQVKIFLKDVEIISRDYIIITTQKKIAASKEIQRMKSFALIQNIAQKKGLVYIVLLDKERNVFKDSPIINKSPLKYENQKLIKPEIIFYKNKEPFFAQKKDIKSKNIIDKFLRIFGIVKINNISPDYIDWNPYIITRSIVKPENGKEKVVGFIEIAVSTIYLINTVRDYIFKIAPVCALIIIVAMIVGFIISLYIVIPIHKLSIGADKFGNGQLEYRINIRRKDEFGKLSNTFNNMAENLKKAYNELKDKYEEVQRLFKLATEDGLTKAFVHRHIIDIFDNELKRAKRYNKFLSFIMCDIDHFKKFNDTYGHQIGDLVLQKTSEILLKNTRENVDYVGRYGGEEFCIILPETTKETALAVAEKLRKIVQETKLEYESGKFISVTMSFGVTTTKGEQTDRDTIISLADKALYKSKTEGRNKVSFCSKE